MTIDNDKLRYFFITQTLSPSKQLNHYYDEFNAYFRSFYNDLHLTCSYILLTAELTRNLHIHFHGIVHIKRSQVKRFKSLMSNYQQWLGFNSWSEIENYSAAEAYVWKETIPMSEQLGEQMPYYDYDEDEINKAQAQLYIKYRKKVTINDFNL